MNNTLYTVNQIAKMFGMHPKTIRRYIQSGSLAAKKFGKEWRVLESDLKAFLDSSTDLREDHLENALNLVHGFIHNKQQESPGTVNTLTVVDVSVSSTEEAAEICNKLIEVIKTKQDDGTNAEFKYFFIEELSKARFILSGNRQYISAMLDAL